ncbi:MAG: polysaccharide biosynthesis C-terminal domain-containing protein [Methylococcales bacterium]
MSIFRKLASQTAIYGLSSIFGRFLNYLLVPLYTYYFSAAEYGVVSEFYAYAGFFSVLLLFGFETGYFRFRDKQQPQKDTAYSTALYFVVLANVGFFLAITEINTQLADKLQYADHPEYIIWFSIILALDAVTAIPFARLRAEDKAWRFAGIKMLEILLTIGLSLFFIVYCPKAYAQQPQSWVAWFYDPGIGVGYIFIANVIASAVKFLFLTPQLLGLAWGFDRALFWRMLRYSLPMVAIGFAGIINEMLDRALLKHLLPYDLQTNMGMLGIYGACYKLSILMSLFIQAFRYAAEPFFFAYAEFRAGLAVVPILLMANLCLGIYVNLSIWYKLTDKTLLGACVSLAGAGLTIALNLLWIPTLGYIGSAWATLACYASMAVLSYLLGRIYYPVAYAVWRIMAYIGLGVALYFAHGYLRPIIEWQWWLLSSALLALYLLTAALFEGRQLRARASH